MLPCRVERLTQLKRPLLSFRIRAPNYPQPGARIILSTIQFTTHLVIPVLESEWVASDGNRVEANLGSEPQCPSRIPAKYNTLACTCSQTISHNTTVNSFKLFFHGRRRSFWTTTKDICILCRHAIPFNGREKCPQSAFCRAGARASPSSTKTTGFRTGHPQIPRKNPLESTGAFFL